MKTTAGRTGTRGPGALLALGLAWLLAAPLTAQTAPVGARVRVTAPEHMEQPCVGRVIESEDPLVVRDRSGTLHTVPLWQIETLEISRGRNHNSTHILVGAIAGAAAGAVIGYASYERPTSKPCSDSGGWFCFDQLIDEGAERFLRATVGGLTGGTGGALVGWAITPERWVPLWASDAGAEIGIAPRGVVVRVGGSRR